MPHRGSGIGPALLALAALLAGAARPAAAQRQIGVGRSVTSTLGPTDGTLASGRSHYRLYSFYGIAGRTVQVDLLSRAFDPWLYLQDRMGQAIADVADSGGGQDARITYKLPYTGMYMMLVGARTREEGGEFTLVVVEVEAPAVPLAAEAPPEPAPAPAPAAPVAAPVTAPSPAPATPDTARSAVQAQPVAPAPVTVPPTDTVARVTAPAPPVVAPPVDTQPRVVPQPAPVVQAPVDTQPRIVVQPPPDTAPKPAPQPAAPAPAPRDTQPTVVAQPVAVAQPAFVPPAPPTGVVPTNRAPGPGEIGQIAVGQVMQGQLSVGDQRMADSSFADTWQFAGTAGQYVTIDAMSDAFGTYVQLFDPDGHRLADDAGSGGGNNSRIVFQLRAAGSYQILVNNSEGRPRTGLYRLSLQ